MSEAQSLVDWVSDPARSNDELFTVELFIEAARGHTWPFSHVDASFEAKCERRRERRLNPAHRPAFYQDELEALQERARTLKFFYPLASNDRPLRDLKALRFFPELENVTVQNSDVSDLTPLAELRKVQRLSIAEYGDLYGCQQLDLAQCGAMAALKYLHLSLHHPWCDLRALANWPELEEVNYAGNVLVWEEVKALPAVRIIAMNQWVIGKLPLRDLRRLPEMPRIKQLTLHETASLEGIERYPSAVNVEIGGCFRDLTPLAAMHNITALVLKGDLFHDLRPLSHMASLREVKFVREWPLDLSPLTDCPQLRKVHFDHCSMMRMEVAALNAGLLPEAADFLADEPRTLKPLKYYRLDKEDKAALEFFGHRAEELMEQRTRFYDGDVTFQKAEWRVHRSMLQMKFDQALGRGWGMIPDHGCFIPVKSFAHTTQMHELIQILREYSACSRFPIHFSFVVAPHGDLSEELEEMSAREQAEAEPEGDYLMKHTEPEQVLQENEEWRQLRAERYEVLKREHLVRLRGEDAIEADLFLVPPEELEEETEQEVITGETDDEGEGMIAIAPPPEPEDSGAENLGEELMFYLDVYEDCVTANAHWVEPAQYTLGVRFEPWSPDNC